MPALTLAEQTALRGILRDAQQRWTRVGARPYQFGAEGADLRFDGSILEMAAMPGLVSVPEISDPNSPTPVMQGPRPQVCATGVVPGAPACATWTSWSLMTRLATTGGW